MIPTLSLSLFGDFRLSSQNQPVQGVDTGRMRSLLAYLALHRDAEITRQRIAFLFWPNSEEGQARTNLRQLLHHLRQSFPDLEHYLDIDARTVKWRSSSPVCIDVAEFIKRISEAEEAAKTADLLSERTALENAARLYSADLMPECYDDWIEPDRDRLRQLLTGALERLTEICEQQGQYQEALSYAERLLTIDEFDESTYRLLIRLHALNKDRASSLRVYNRCVEVLSNELDIEPAAETQEAHHRITRAALGPEPLTSKEPEIPLVGRERERSALLQAWQRTEAGNAHVVLLHGEAGIGKTRLAQELIQTINRQGFAVATACCYAAEGRLAYGPVTEWLKADPIHEAVLDLDNVWQREIARLLPELLAERPDLSPPAALTESWERQRLFSALARAVLASRQPLLLFIDDIQWADPGTVEWLHYLLRFEPCAKILIVAAARAGALSANGPLLSLTLELRRSSVLTEIELGAIDAVQTALLARHVSCGNLDDKAVASLFASTEGNPLFVVEMTRARMEERNTGASRTKKIPGNLTLPQKVQAVIQTRLFNLSPSSKKLLELAAIIGRVFTFDILSHAYHENEETLIQSLEELLEHRLIREQERMVYDFSHDKIREVTTAGISGTRRCLLHRRVAEALEQTHAGELDQFNGQLATHWENAGFPLHAISYCEQGGKTAQRIFANGDAEEHLQRGLRLVREHLTGQERDRRELDILRLLSLCLVQGRGYGASQVQHVGARVWELSKQLNQQPGSPLLRMLAISKLVGSDISNAEQFGIQLLEQAKNDNDDVAGVEAHYVLGVTYHWQGRFVSARKHLEKAIALYDPQNHNKHITAYAQDPAVVCRIRLALVLWHLGYPVASQATGIESLALAEKLEHPFSRAYALHWYTWLQNLRDDPAATLKYAKISIAFSSEYRFPYFATQSGILHGWALFKMGDVEDGIQKMREGLSCFRSTGSEIGCPYYRALIAEALAASGSFAQSLPLLEEAVKSVQNTGESWSEADILRMKGAVLMRAPSENYSPAEHSFKEAIEVARKQGAKTDALRAALYLKRFWLGSGRKEEAGSMFQDVYCWATHGLDAKEMKTVTALLEQWTEGG
ncbi:MAG: AAA family ATPase [bacterium]